ncbi:MAG TPA: S4 domain-containing protein, partial [Methyloradius sp.]
MTNLSKISNVISDASAAMITVDEGGAGQRIDNFLCKTLKGVPKSHIYRILRSGEVRVNKKRTDATYRLVIDDLVRVPPIRTSTTIEDVVSPQNITPRFEQSIIFEDDAMLVI